MLEIMDELKIREPRRAPGHHATISTVKYQGVRRRDRRDLLGHEQKYKKEMQVQDTQKANKYNLRMDAAGGMYQQYCQPLLISSFRRPLPFPSPSSSRQPALSLSLSVFHSFILSFFFIWSHLLYPPPSDCQQHQQQLDIFFTNITLH